MAKVAELRVFIGWLAAAAKGDRFVYCEGVVLARGAEAVRFARTASDRREVRLFQSREGKGYRWIAERTATPLNPAAHAAQVAADADAAAVAVARGIAPTAAQRMLGHIEDLADKGQPLPSLAVLARDLDLKDADAARYMLRKLVSKGALRIVNRGPQRARIAVIVKSGRRTAS